MGKRSFAELEREDLLALIRARLPRLDRIEPARIRLAGGVETKVRYAKAKPPWIASRLQMTSDLAGFWYKWPEHPCSVLLL